MSHSSVRCHELLVIDRCAEMPVSHGDQIRRISVKARQTGFTLVELMIALTLGLLLTAAASQLLFGGIAGLKLQQSGSELHDNGIFGLEYIAKDIRLANFANTTNRVLTDTSANGGIVFTRDTSTSTSSSLSNVRTSNLANAYLPDETNLTQSNVGPTNIVAASGTSGSDQLTIQFQAPAAMSDCEGGAVAAGTQVVERYFLREEAPIGQSPKNLVLACDAAMIAPPATPVVAGLQVITGLGGNGQIIMNRVDYLQFRLGTQTQDTLGNMTYYTIAQYRALAVVPKPRIISIQIAALVRSMDNTANAAIDPGAAYTMLNQSVTPIATTPASANRYVRQVYQTTIALRNAMGVAS